MQTPQTYSRIKKLTIIALLGLAFIKVEKVKNPILVGVEYHPQNFGKINNSIIIVSNSRSKIKVLPITGYIKKTE